MKKLLVLFGAICASIVIALGLDAASKAYLAAHASRTLYYNDDYRNDCIYLMERITTDDTVLVLGSSELHAEDDLAFPKALFQNGASDFHPLLVGRARMQSLQHAIDVGFYEEMLPSRKVVLIVSPQWFTEEHIEPDVFRACFQEEAYEAFLQNPHISDETKRAVSARVHALLVTDETQLSQISDYETVLLDHQTAPFLKIANRAHDMTRDLRNRLRLIPYLRALPDVTGEPVLAAEIDFDALRSAGEKEGRASVTTNDFGIEDTYFAEMFADDLASFEGINAHTSYQVSPEYDDLRLFLQVCAECGIRPLIVSVPVNGYWYDYTGFDPSDRQAYYAGIRSICAEYDVPLADFSDREYELYFLRDAMHLGWKGWVSVDEAIYDYACED